MSFLMYCGQIGYLIPALINHVCDLCAYVLQELKTDTFVAGFSR